MQLALRVIAILSFIVAIVWWLAAPGFEPLSALLVGLLTLLTSFVVEKPGEGRGETLDERNRRVMLDHVENFWVKGVLEKSLHGAALLELGVREDPGALRYPWTVKRESNDEPLPPGKSRLEIFNEVGMGRSLLVLGAPGAGKTTMLLQLARGLLERAREEGAEPIPVIFNLASWTETQTLADWLAEQLNQVYYVPKKIAPSWVAEDKMLLLLDGLDEVREDQRPGCVEAINAFRKEHGFTSLAVCSREGEYHALQTKLAFEGAVTIQPLTPAQVDVYISQLGGGMGMVRQALRRDRELQELASTPLILSIMALAYKDTGAEDLPGSGTIEDQRKHLFDTYIDRMFERSARSANPPFTKTETLHYLGWLARTMIRHNITAYQVESMQPSWLGKHQDVRQYLRRAGLISGLIFGLIIGLVVGLVSGLIIGLIMGLLGGLSMGLLGGLIFGLFGGLDNEIVMVDRLKWSWEEARGGLILGLVVGLVSGLVSGLILWQFSRLLVELLVELVGRPVVMPVVGPLFGLAFGLALGLAFVLNIGLSSGQVEETTYPGQRLKQTFLSGLFTTLMFGLLVVLFVGPVAVPLFGLVFGLVFGPVAGPLLGLGGGLILWLAGGLVYGLEYGYRSLIQHYVLRWLLARQRLLPRRLIPFLEYCVSLIFLRRAGGSYIFVHRLLMEHFAGLGAPQGVPPEEEQVDPPEGGMPPLQPPQGG